MKTNVKTTIKGSENLIVRESVKHIYDELAQKHSFILLTLISHDKKETQVGVKKTCIKMFKQMNQ